MMGIKRWAVKRWLSVLSDVELKDELQRRNLDRAAEKLLRATLRPYIVKPKVGEHSDG